MYQKPGSGIISILLSALPSTLSYSPPTLLNRNLITPLLGRGRGVGLSYSLFERFQAALVAASEELVWELGQTCEAAGNGIPIKRI